MSVAHAAELWYNVGAQFFTFSSRPWSDNKDKKVWPFAQLIWASSTEVGCGAALGTWPAVKVCNGDASVVHASPAMAI